MKEHTAFYTATQFYTEKKIYIYENTCIQFKIKKKKIKKISVGYFKLMMFAPTIYEKIKKKFECLSFWSKKNI